MQRSLSAFLLVVAITALPFALFNKSGSRATTGTGNVLEPGGQPARQGGAVVSSAMLLDAQSGDSRVMAAVVDPDRKWMVLVQREPGGPHFPLALGSMEIAAEQGSRTVQIEAGHATVPSVMTSGKYSVSGVKDSGGDSLFFCNDDESATVRCYSYPGIFVRPVDTNGVPTEEIEALEFSGDENRAADFDVPPSSRHVAALSVDGLDPTYVPALDAFSPFYLLRVKGKAWVRVDSADCAPGGAITIPARPSGSVVFQEVYQAYPRMPRLIVNAVGGQQMMRPLLRPEVYERIEGWPVGEYEAYLTLSSRDAVESAVTEVARFTVREGQTTTVAITPLVDSETAGVGHLRGILRFEAWDLVEPWYQRYGLRLNIESLSGPDSLPFKMVDRRQRLLSTKLMQELPGRPGGSPSWAWDAGEYPAGAYRMQVEPIRAWVDFSVVAGETTVLDQAIPEMAVTVLDFGGKVEDPTSMTAFLSYPREWQNPPRINEAPKLIEGEEGTAMMICSPGDYTLRFLCGIEFKEQDLSLDPGWNMAYVDLDTDKSCVLAMIDKGGKPLAPSREDWDRITVESQATGQKLKVLPRHVRRNGVGQWSECIVTLPEDGAAVIRGLSVLGATTDSAEVVLKADERIEFRVE